MGFEHELRLLWAIAINLFLGLAAYRAARKLGAGDRVQIWLDALLLWWAGQYAVVGLLGIAGLLSPLSIAVLACLVAVVGLIAFRSSPPLPDGSRREQLSVLVGVSVVAGYVVALVWNLRVLPPMSDDPLTYHLPAAATWLMNHRISVYETWFFNPANTYSPLGGSIFATWLMAPFGNDVAARFMQAPAIFAIYLAGLQISRRLGATVLSATLLAAAATMCAPMVRQIGLAKDDLFLTAFVLMCINAIDRADRLSAWRFGIALGLAAGMKVTSVYTLGPMFLLLLPTRAWNWRRFAIALGCAVAIAGPWYIRNWLFYRNPLFPVEVRVFGMQLLSGLFETTHSPRLREWAGLNEVFVTGYFSLGRVLGLLVSVALAGAIAFSWKRLQSDRVVRVCLLGPLIGTAAFVLTSPYGEIRFLYPWILTALLGSALWPARLIAPLAIAAVVVSLVTGFQTDLVAELLPIALLGAATAFIVIWLARRSRRWCVATLGFVTVVAAATVFVNWRSYVVSLPEYADQAWENKYGDLGKAWTYLRTQTPADAPVAYTGTYLTYPLMGQNLSRRVIHVPVSATVTDLTKLPHFEHPMSARNMLLNVIPATQFRPEHDQWLVRLSDSGARYLLIARHPPASASAPVEWAWARGDERFRQVFINSAAVIYEVSGGAKATGSPAPKP